MNDPEQIIANGIFKGIMKVIKFLWLSILAGGILFIVITEVFDALKVGYDDTDGESRSGMSLRIDHGTGCHYLESGSGSLTPRLNSNGDQEGCK